MAEKTPYKTWQKQKSDRKSYLSPPSKKIIFEMKMKNKENAKVQKL